MAWVLRLSGSPVDCQEGNTRGTSLRYEDLRFASTKVAAQERAGSKAKRGRKNGSRISEPRVAGSPLKACGDLRYASRIYDTLRQGKSRGDSSPEFHAKSRQAVTMCSWFVVGSSLK